MNQSEIIVFAAASLAEAFIEIADQFELDNPDSAVILNFAGSQQLAHQLSQGAPADVFASANNRQMNAAINTGRVGSDSQRSFASNDLVVVIPQDNPARLQSLADLARPGLKLIFAAPEGPAGQYTQLFLSAAAQDETYGPAFRSGVLGNVVSYEENVRAVLSKISLGAADAGIVYTSDLIGAPARQIGSLTIPEELNMKANYPIARVNNGGDPELAQSFIDFVLSSKGQDILGAYGFLPGTKP